jgi:signal transduction histidine kinase
MINKDWQSIAGAILQNTNEGILLLDLQGKVLAVNQGLLRMLRPFPSGELSTQVITEGSDVKPSILNMLGYPLDEWAADCQTLLSRKEDVKRKQLILGESQPIAVERTTSPVRDTSGGVIGWLLLFRDISDKVELAHMRDDMMQMLVHDLRSPLAVILGSLGTMKMLLSEGSREHSGQLIELMLRSSDRILRLVNDLLDIGRLEGGIPFLKPESVEIIPLLEETARQIAPIAREARITIEVQPGQDLPILQLDPAHLSRVLTNLLDNAVKFTPDGGQIILWARMNPGDTPACVEIGVTDNGAGISEEIQERLFEKFQQVLAVHGRRSGSGLGLYYCKLVVEAHGGRIWVQSQSGIGSTFTISLPIKS